MKRPIIIIGVLLATGFAVISLWKAEQRGRDAETDTRTEFSDEDKAEIRRFWDLHRKATALRHRGEWAEAVSVYYEALAIDPDHEDALYYVGNALFELEKYDEAVAAWRRLTEVNVVSARAHFQLGSVYSCGAPNAPFDLAIAEREFRRALAINKEETGPILKLGEVSLLGGRSDQALTYFKTAIQTNSRSVEANYLVGYLHWQAGDHEAALQALRRAVECSRVKRTPGTPSSEGDTRKGGGRPMLAEGAGRKSLFAPMWAALKTWEEGEVSLSRMVEEYRALDQRLRDLTTQGAG